MEWRTIPGIDPRYEAAPDGSIRSWVRLGTNGGWCDEPHPLKGSPGSGGYLMYGVKADNGRFFSTKGHRLVAEAYIGPMPDGLMTRHKNGNPTDNRVENLGYGTCKENHEDRDRHGRTARGEHSGKSKLTKKEVLEVVVRYASGESQMAIAKSLGMGQSAISSIIRGVTWSHVTGIGAS